MFNGIVDTYLLITLPAAEKRRQRLLMEAENHLMDCERELENAQAAVGAMRKRVARLRKQAPTRNVDIVITGEAPDSLVAHHLFATATIESTDEPTVVAFLWGKVKKMVKGWFGRD